MGIGDGGQGTGWEIRTRFDPIKTRFDPIRTRFDRIRTCFTRRCVGREAPRRVSHVARLLSKRKCSQIFPESHFAPTFVQPSRTTPTCFYRLGGVEMTLSAGITRDRMYIRAFWGDSEFMMVDTGGLESLPGNPQDAPSVDTAGHLAPRPSISTSSRVYIILCLHHLVSTTACAYASTATTYLPSSSPGA